jgi:hypothetical protein
MWRFPGSEQCTRRGSWLERVTLRFIIPYGRRAERMRYGYWSRKAQTKPALIAPTVSRGTVSC